MIMSVKHWKIKLNHNTYIKYSVEFLHLLLGTSLQTIQGTIARNINMKQASHYLLLYRSSKDSCTVKYLTSCKPLSCQK